MTLSLVVGFTTATGSGQALAASNQIIDINIAQDDLLDVVLTLGSTDSDVSSFDGDLTSALVDLGVQENNIAIQSIQSNDVSAGNTTSGWLSMTITGTSGNKVIRAWIQFIVGPIISLSKTGVTR